MKSNDISNENYLKYKYLPYRAGVGLMIINPEGLIFLGKRVDTKFDSWQMPQGGINIGETPSRAALREMEEEIGCNKGIIIAESKFWYSYDLPYFLIPKLWEGAYRGQKQKWFLIKFTGREEEININTSFQEFVEWKWANLQDLQRIIVPFKKKLYKAIVNEFNLFLSSKV